MATTYKFGPFRLDATAEILFHGTEPTGLGRRAIALLRLLLDSAGEPRPQPPLIDAAWHGLASQESNLTVQMAARLRVLEKAAGGAVWIETMPRRGYRFVGPRVARENSPAEPARGNAVREPRPG